MPSAKRERQRENRELGRIEQAAAHKAAKRKKSSRNMVITVTIVAVLFVGLAFLVSRGGDDDEATTTTTLVTPATFPVPVPVVSEKDGSQGGPALALPDQAALDAISCSTEVPVNASRPSFASVPPFTTDVARIFTATLTTSCGPIVVQLDPSASPVTTNNFVFLARQGYFDGITFHRVVGDFVVQTGDPTASGSGGPGYSFGDELPPLYPYRLGSLAMANSGPDTNGSQFFICTTARESCGLPAPSYNLFGQVISGIDVAKKIESFSSSDGSPAPTQPIYLLSVTVEETDAAPSVTTTETATTAAGVITTTTG